MAADAEDDREAAEEEERERLAAEAELTHARGLQLQVAYERWRASEEGIAHAKFRATLPISQLEAQVRVAMEDGQVAVVCGETGSGKSTQVPQMLLEHALESGRGGVTSVICTQPRRIAATSLARRVAQERGEQAGARGAMVGYQVRLESKRTESTKLLFCTTGIALRMMLSDPPLQGVSHVVVDEVHERDTQTDQLLLLLRELMPTRPDLKVVLMSATVQAELFSRYFDGAAILTSKGRTFPVDEHYLEHALKLTGHVLPTDSPCWLRNAGEWHKHSFAVHNRAITQEWQETGGSVNPEYSDARYAEYGEGVCNVLRSLNEHVINYDLIFDLLGYIDDTYEEGAVLVFLPGLSDITTVLGLCQADRRLGDTRRFCVLPLHSSLSPAEQSAVFETMPPGVRKVVLATNIAETSITIDDAVFVIDSGRAKQMLFNEQKQMRRLVDVWISQAEARQRAGRAGRVRAGHVFKLYTRHRAMVHMSPSRLPEMLRGPLQEICLQLRLAPLLTETDLRTAFAKALTPPPEAAVTAAILGLQRCAALDENEQLTPLGRHLAALPVDIGVGRLILYGALLRCAWPILLIAAALSDRSPPRAVQMVFNTAQSDHLAVVEAHRKWDEHCRQHGKGSGYRFCEKHFLSERTLQGMTDMANQFWDNLANLGLLPSLSRLPPEQREAARAAANRHADNVELLKAVLCAGLFPNVLKAKSGKGGLELNQQKQAVAIHPSSFNRGAQRFESGWLVYHEKVATGKVFVHDVTAVTSLDLFLFGAEPQVLHAQHKVIIDGWIDLRISPRTAVLFKALRKQLFELMALRIAANEREDAQSAWTLGGGSEKALPQPGGAGWPPPMETREQAQGALLTALVWLIGKGLDLQADEQAAAAAAAAIAKLAKGGASGSRR
ncbi:ATP-dependent RNA helicase dhx29-like protein [Chrysochromulina tobinii]|uniref:RNA helicase n=1 Tax=Chrysochromulina tobinii TaxID=1460289 RepID=A0A0M0JFJ6_9EUKA|nr:ATP-dependent RNA helicase dhx29-like protein [Chrysochromulina tobinii]|eukprot:KOO25225.1 ATP-dependent RNA helicase dhx29-like protein [Chrysochromulina sp. CCMP291]